MKTPIINFISMVFSGLLLVLLFANSSIAMDNKSAKIAAKTISGQMHLERRLFQYTTDLIIMRSLADHKDPGLQQQIFDDAQGMIGELTSYINFDDTSLETINLLVYELVDLTNKINKGWERRRNKTEYLPAAIYLPRMKGDIEETYAALANDIAQLKDKIKAEKNLQECPKLILEVKKLKGQLLQFLKGRGDYLNKDRKDHLENQILEIEESLISPAKQTTYLCAPISPEKHEIIELEDDDEEEDWPTSQN